jgi:hypothetical protein
MPQAAKYIWDQVQELELILAAIFLSFDGGVRDVESDRREEVE